MAGTMHGVCSVSLFLHMSAEKMFGRLLLFFKTIILVFASAVQCRLVYIKRLKKLSSFLPLSVPRARRPTIMCLVPLLHCYASPSLRFFDLLAFFPRLTSLSQSLCEPPPIL